MEGGSKKKEKGEDRSCCYKRMKLITASVCLVKTGRKMERSGGGGAGWGGGAPSGAMLNTPRALK